MAVIIVITEILSWKRDLYAEKWCLPLHLASSMTMKLILLFSLVILPLYTQLAPPVVEPQDTPPAEEVQTPSTEEVQTPSTEEVQTPSTEEVQTPSTEEVQTPPAEEVQTPLTEEVQTPSTEEVQTPSTEEVQVSPAEEVQVSPAEEVQVSPAEEVQTPSTEEVQVSPAEEVQTPPAEEVQDFVLEQFTNSAGEVFDLSTFTNYGVFFLEDVTIANLQGQDGTAAGNVNFNFKKLVVELIEEENEVILRKLAEELAPELAASNDLAAMRKVILKLLSPQPAEKLPVLDSTSLLETLPVKGLILKRADIVDVYNNTVGDVSERMVDLYGRVSLFIDNSSLGADFIRINLTRRESYAEGNVSLVIGETRLAGEKLLWDLDAAYGYVFNARGEILDRNYFEGRIIRVNTRDYITVEDGWITFSSNRDPYYRISSVQFDGYGEKKWIVNGVLTIVGDHPFLWFPYYISYPLSTRLELSFGETRREGYYALTHYVFPVPYINEVVFKFNIYEKLGLYTSLENHAAFGNLSYSLFFAGAFYTYNENTRTTPSLAYTHHTGQYVESRTRFRHRVTYEQDLDLIPASQTSVRSSIGFGVTNVSDPFISGNFPQNLSHNDWQKLLERHDNDENLYNPRVTDKDGYNVNYTLSAPSVSVGAKFDWIYDVYDDPDLEAYPVDERYTMYLKKQSLPNVNISHSSTIDPTKTESARLFFVNLAYNLGFNYNGEANFKDGDEAGEGIGNDGTVEPYELINEKFDTGLNIGLSRPINFGKGINALLPFGDIAWFSWTLTPSFSVSYKRDWVGKDYSETINEDQDRADLNIQYGFANSIGFNQSVNSVFDHAFSFSFSVGETDTTYRLPAGQVFTSEERDACRELSVCRTEAVNYALTANFLFNFPSAQRVNVWAAAYDYRSMLPFFSFELGYSERLFTSEERLAEGLPYNFDRYSSRALNSSFSTTHKGYGLFYVPKLDYIFNYNLALSYDLTPVENEDGEYLSTNIFTDNSFWHESRLGNFGGSFNLDFVYQYYLENFININNHFTYSLFDANTDTIFAELITYKFNFGINYTLASTSTNYVQFKNLGFAFNWGYYFRERDYLSDNMSLSLSFSLDIVQRYSISFSLNSYNNDAYRYFPEKAAAQGVDTVNFFEDVFASMGFRGVDGQLSGLFKLNSFTFALQHDIGDWFAQFSYTFVPTGYSDDSLRGYYLEHRISFEVNLKPERDPRGSVTSSNDPFFEEIKEDLGADIFSNVRRN